MVSAISFRSFRFDVSPFSTCRHKQVRHKQVRHKQVSHKQGNKRVLSSDYWAYINWGTYNRGGAYIWVGLYSGGAYIWNEVSVSTCGGLIHGGGLYSEVYGSSYYCLNPQCCWLFHISSALVKLSICQI